MKTATDDTQETLDRTAETLRRLKAGFDVETARREAGAAVEAQAEAKRAARRQAQAKRWERLELEAEAKRKAFAGERIERQWQAESAKRDTKRVVRWLRNRP